MSLPPLGPAPLSPEVLETLAAGDAEHVLTNEGNGRGTWRITDDGAAEWAGRHRAMALAEAAQIEEQAAEWVAQIEAWKQDRIHAPQRKAAFFEAQLRDYALRLRAAGADATLTLPSVTVRTRQTNPAVKVADEAALLEWLDANLTPAEVNAMVSRKVLLAAVRKFARAVVDGEGPDMVAVTVDGEVPPGLTVEPAKVSASVT